MPSKTISIATWNINSVRLRVDLVAKFVAEARPDVVCLQEIKCVSDQFPFKAFKAMGLRYTHVVGQKGWHGVAIASRLPLEAVEAPALCMREDVGPNLFPHGRQCLADRRVDRQYTIERNTILAPARAGSL